MSHALLRAAALTTAVLLVTTGCGGGGGGDEVDTGTTPAPTATTPSPAPSTPAFATYRDGTLPGRLLVVTAAAGFELFDLTTGLRSQPPALADDTVGWHPTPDPAIQLRSREIAKGKRQVERVRTSDWTVVGNPIVLDGETNALKLSFDGRFLLTFQGPVDGLLDERRLAIFDMATGQKVKQGSRLDGRMMLGSPAAWLPDGRYIYLVGRDLYESSPTSATSTLRTTVAGLPDNSVYQNNVDIVSEFTHFRIDPAGTRVVFNWRVVREHAEDSQIMMMNVDGSGLKQLTAAPDPKSAINYSYGGASWSPDGRFVIGGLYLSSVITAPLPEGVPGVPAGVIGATGCDTNRLFVLPADAEKVALAWPEHHPDHEIKVRASANAAATWISPCGGMQWLP
jgi:hypothetical protein